MNHDFTKTGIQLLLKEDFAIVKDVEYLALLLPCANIEIPHCIRNVKKIDDLQGEFVSAEVQ